MLAPKSANGLLSTSVPFGSGAGPKSYGLGPALLPLGVVLFELFEEFRDPKNSTLSATTSVTYLF